jgi:polyhydroxybutyrate depolymerase
LHIQPPAAIYIARLLIVGSIVGSIGGCSSEPWTGSVTQAGQYYLELEHDGLSRSYQLHVPKGYTGRSGLPLHFDIHPWYTNAFLMEQMTGFRTDSDIRNFILVQPNGVDRSWNAGPKCCSPANEDDVDDVGFIRAINTDLIAKGLNIDPEKIYLDGMSNGGYLSNRIACEAPGFVAGIAVVVGSIGYDSVLQCQPSQPVPVLMISGGDDNLPGRTESFDHWLKLNNCATSKTESFGVFSCETYTDCDSNVETTHCVGEGVGHCWPGTDFFIYGCNQDLNASQYILDFFSRIER